MRNAIIFVFSLVLFLFIGCTEENIVTAPSADYTPPDIWWTAPNPGSTLADTVRLRLGIFDEDWVDSVRLLKNGAEVVTIIPPYAIRGNSTTIPPYYCRGGQRGGQNKNASTSPFAITRSNPPLPPPSVEGGDVEGCVEYLWDTRSDSDGVHVWEARAWDDSGNMGTSPALLVRVKNNPEPPPEDHTPPVVSWCSPQPGDTLEGTVELRFQVLDDVGVDSVKVYLNGREWQNLIDGGQYFDCQVNWITSEVMDGDYIVQVKAWDCSQNVGMSEVIWFHVWNNRPRVLWVPDDYEKIQDAINASQDGDTVRVRAGIYREGLRIMKRVWLESEEGPELTIIEAVGYGFGIAVYGVRDTVSSAIRGFTIRKCESDGIYLGEGASLRIMNNIVLNAERAGIAIWHGFIYSAIVNNIIGNSSPALHIYISTANISNNILFNIENTAFWNGYLYENPVVPDYNIAFEYGRITNNPPIHFGDHNIFDQDPQFLENSYRLSELSPGIDSGNPELLDPDGSRSDIGAYGGPHAYP